MVGSQQVEAEGAAQVAEEAFGQVGGFQAIAPGAQPQFQEGDGRFEALPELLDEGGLGARPAAQEVEGPALSLLDALGFVDPPEIPPQTATMQPAASMQERLQVLQPVTQARLELSLRIDDLGGSPHTAAAVRDEERDFFQPALVKTTEQQQISLGIFGLGHLPVEHAEAAAPLHADRH